MTGQRRIKLNREDDLFDAYEMIENGRLHLSVDDRRDRPFHCDVCRETYEPCVHWHLPDREF